jgi:hypothetical protein
MTTEGKRQPGHWFLVAAVVLSALTILADRSWPGSAAAAGVRIGWFGTFAIWFGLKVWTGYRRRRPHWTRQSWVRFLRLAVMPVVALALVFYGSSFDFSTNTFGAPGSATRLVWVGLMLSMMILGAQGVIVAIDWMERGEAAEPFTRTRWFQRRHGP